MEGPVGPLARPVRTPGDFDEAIIKAEVVSQRILPSLCVLAIVGEVIHDELVDVREGKHPLWGVPEGHGR